MNRKPYRLPDIDLSNDDGDQRWHNAGGQCATPVTGEDGQIAYYRWNGLSPGHYASYYRLCVAGAWADTVDRYESNPEDPFAAWWYIDHHPIFWRFEMDAHPDFPKNHVSHLIHDGALAHWGWPEITPHKVNPATQCVDEDDTLNTEIEWWCEFGKRSLYPNERGFHESWHDYERDCGASTYDDAVVELARVIHEYYGNDREVADSE